MTRKTYQDKAKRTKWTTTVRTAEEIANDPSDAESEEEEVEKLLSDATLPKEARLYTLAA